MNDSEMHFETAGAERAKLRASVLEVGRIVDGLKSDAGLTASWAKLVEVLALGPAPELRACPSCGAVGMAAATRCGRCWVVLAPEAVAHAPVATPAAITGA